MERRLVYQRGNEKYHSSYLLWKGENLVTVYEDTAGRIQTHEDLCKIPNLDECEGLVKLKKGFDYVIDEEGYFQYIKKVTTNKVYLVFEVVNSN